MARKNRDLSNVFDSLQSKESKNVVNGNNINEKVSLKEKEDVKNDSNNNITNIYDESVPVEKDVTPSDLPLDNYDVDNEKDSNDFSEFKKDILSKYNEKRKKKTMEETHIRTTFLLERSLSKRQIGRASCRE